MFPPVVVPGKITGDNADNFITVGDGIEEVEGGAGNDRLLGEEGSQTLTGGSGNDTFAIVADSGSDTITDFDAANEFIDLSEIEDFGFAQAQGVLSQSGSDVLIDFGDGNVTRIANTDLEDLTSDRFGDTNSDIADTITGNAASNVISGFGGNDIIDAGGGNDTITGGKGNDSIVGGAGTDIALFTGNLDDYDFTETDDGKLILTDTVGTDGIDTLSGVENFSFADG
ncbi:unnamed protein product, partial [Ectocarpus sp. 8 AP-2014]